MVSSCRLGNQTGGEDILIGRGLGRGFRLLAGHDVELGNAVVFVGRRLRRRIAFALLGHDMDQNRALVIAVPHVA